MSRPRALLLSIFCMLASACATTRVNVSMAHPARVPVNVFPRVFLIALGEPESSVIIDALQAQLARDDVRADKTDTATITAAFRARTLPAASAVLVMDVRFSESMELRRNDPNAFCGGLNCGVAGMDYRVAVLDATCTMRVYDAPTGALLQRESTRAREEGPSSFALRDLALHAFVVWAEEQISAAEISEVVTFHRLGRAPTTQAIEQFERADYPAALALFAQAQRQAAADAREHALATLNLATALAWSTNGTLAAQRARVVQAQGMLAQSLSEDTEDARASLLRDFALRLETLTQINAHQEARLANRARARNALLAPPPSYLMPYELGPVPSSEPLR